MNPDEFFSSQSFDYRFSNLLLIGCLLFGLGFILYAFWQFCVNNAGDQNNRQASSDRLFMKQVYAHEIEPGLIVLQNETGDYFRILKDYDMKATGNQYGALSCTRPEMTQPNQHMTSSVAGMSQNGSQMTQIAQRSRFDDSAAAFQLQSSDNVMFEQETPRLMPTAPSGRASRGGDRASDALLGADHDTEGYKSVKLSGYSN